jgi:hypothetical protein
MLASPRMLLCPDREQRLSYILGAMFGVSDTVATELLDISPENFRQRLARARRDLRNFMNDKCGLVNQRTPATVPRRPAASFRQAASVRKTSRLPASESARCEKPHRRHMKLSRP